jgi:hypothetical protein
MVELITRLFNPLVETFDEVPIIFDRVIDQRYKWVLDPGPGIKHGGYHIPRLGKADNKVLDYINDNHDGRFHGAWWSRLVVNAITSLLVSHGVDATNIAPEENKGMMIRVRKARANKYTKGKKAIYLRIGTIYCDSPDRLQDGVEIKLRQMDRPGEWICREFAINLSTHFKGQLNGVKMAEIFEGVNMIKAGITVGYANIDYNQLCNSDLINNFIRDVALTIINLDKEGIPGYYD